MNNAMVKPMPATRVLQRKEAITNKIVDTVTLVARATTQIYVYQLWMLKAHLDDDVDAAAPVAAGRQVG